MFREILALPVDHQYWEVDLVDSPFTVDDVELEGLYVVVQADGLIRAAGPLVMGQSLAEVLREACLSPTTGAEARRPSELRFRRRELILRAHLGVGERLRLVSELTETDRVVEALSARFGSPDTSIADGESWRPVVRRLARVAPWRVLSDTVEFRFSGGPTGLSEAVAMVLGQGGEQIGVVVYPTEADRDAFVGSLDQDPHAALRGIRIWCCNLDRAEDIPEENAEQVRESGLEPVGGLLPMIFAMSGGQAGPLTSAEGAALRAAVYGVLGAFEAHGGELEHRPAITRVGVPEVGEVTVRTTLRRDEDELEDADALVFSATQAIFTTGVRLAGEELRALVIKTYKQDARRLAKHLRAVDAMSVVPEAGTVAFRAWAGPHDLGLISRIRLDDPTHSINRPD